MKEGVLFKKRSGVAFETVIFRKPHPREEESPRKGHEKNDHTGPKPSVLDGIPFDLPGVFTKDEDMIPLIVHEAVSHPSGPCFLPE